MRRLEERGEEFVKKRFYEKLSEQYGRTLSSYEYRMQNISYVYSLMGRRWVTGLKPAGHVGTNIFRIIEELILENEKTSDVPIMESDGQINQIRKQKPVPKPYGIKKPKQKEITITTYKRNPNVIAWLLENSNGNCECCEQPAPFIKTDGNFYLDVHHLKRLVDGGTDTTSNAIAACPNCHGELYYGENRGVILEQLYTKIERLEQE